MNQTLKFYVASFLKNQTYFVPIMVIFFQDLGLSYTQIFAVLTSGAVLSFLIEIPTGIFADLHGKRRSILISKWIIFLAFVAFGFADGFWTLLVANLLYEVGESFRSGTETAYVYDYLASDKSAPSYTKVKAQQKFYARISESIAAIVGGYLAVILGFNFVFFIAAIPALVNALQTHTWVHLPGDAENTESPTLFLKEAFGYIGKTRVVRTLVLNVALFSTVFVALGTFVQPYMLEAGLTVEYFGYIYSVFLVIAAFLAKYASNLEERFGDVRVMNVLTILPIIPLAIIGFGFSHYVGIALLFFVLFMEYLRSPLSNSIFHDHVPSKNRATMGSILSLFQTGAQIIMLPLIGLVSDTWSIYTAILILTGLVVLISLFFRIPSVSKKAA